MLAVRRLITNLIILSLGHDQLVYVIKFKAKINCPEIVKTNRTKKRIYIYTGKKKCLYKAR